MYELYEMCITVLLRGTRVLSRRVLRGGNAGGRVVEQTGFINKRGGARLGGC